MHKIESFDHIQRLSGQIRSLRKGFVTNFYWDSNKHPYWIKEGELQYQQFNNCVLMIHHNEGFANLFYIATDYEAISSSFNKINFDTDLVIDIVCRGEGSEEKGYFEKMGFQLYKSLYRMNHTGTIVKDDWKKDNDVRFASKEDALMVYQTLKNNFDPLCEQLPSLLEIKDFIDRKQILVIKENNHLCSFLIAELIGLTWYWRYWYTSPEYRNLGIGAKLLHYSLIDAKNSKRQLFWVISDNENAIKRYYHYGFKRENMNDYVMIKENNKNNERKNY